jgi:hypothetical protein
VGGAAAFVLFGPVDCDERHERFSRLVVMDSRAAVGGVDVEPRAHRLVENPAHSFAREPVELIWPYYSCIS